MGTKNSPLALPLSRRVVLQAAGAVTLAVGCGEGAGPLVDVREPMCGPDSPYPLDTDGDDEMTAPAQGSHFNKVYDPLLLYAQTVVTPGAASGPNVAALMNPHGLPMELLEIRWQIYPNNTVTDVFKEITGAGIGVKLDLGNIELVDADVPLNSFGTARDDADRSATTTTLIYPDPAVTTVTTNPYAYRWRLKHPLYVPPGCVATPIYSHLGQNHFPVTVDTVYIARTLPIDYVPPMTLRAPWVGSYNSISFDNLANQAAGRDFSSELDLINPFRQPLELARLSGRCVGVLSGTGSAQKNLELLNQFRYTLGKVRIRSRSGDELARSPTPFNGLFPYDWRVWDIPGGWTMRPGEFYKVQLTVDATTTGPDAATLGAVQYIIATTGYRQLHTKTYLAAAQGDQS